MRNVLTGAVYLKSFLRSTEVERGRQAVIFFFA